LDLKADRERELQFNTAGRSEFQVRSAAVVNDRLANDFRRNGTHSSGTDDDRFTLLCTLLHFYTFTRLTLGF